MYREFLQVLLRAVNALNTLDQNLEIMACDNALKPYLGNIPVMMDGEIVGELRNEGVGWGYFPTERPGAIRTFGVGWTPLADMYPAR